MASNDIIRMILNTIEEALEQSYLPTLDEMELRARVSELETQAEDIRRAVINESIRDLPDVLDRIASEIDSIGSSLYTELGF